MPKKSTKKVRPKGRPKRRLKKTKIKKSKKPAKKSIKKTKKPVKPVKKVVKKRPVKKVIKKKLAKRVAKKKIVEKKVTRKKPMKRKSRKPTKKPKGKIIKKRKMVKRPAKKRVVKKKPIKRRKPIKKKATKPRRRKAAKRRARPRKRAIKKARKPVRRKPRKRKKVRIARRIYSIGGPLEQLFESPAKVQVMKLFFRNPEESFLLKEVAKIMRQNLARIRQEMKRLEKIGLLRAKQISPRKQLFSINPNFDFFNELRELILRSSPVSKDKMLKAIRGLGKIKLVLLSGLLVGDGSVKMGQDMSRADLLIVGDNINQRKLTTFIKNLEAEAGTDINCVVMTTEEFNYRYDMYDRFVRDLLNEKCEFLINKLGL